MDFHHTSVLLGETVSALVTDPGGIYVDCTLGGAGHAEEIIKRLSPSGWFIGIDQDAEAVAAGTRRLADAQCRVDIVQDNFRNFDSVLDGLGAELVTGVVFDLGVSSRQLDAAERGFSYMNDGPLDMRMNKAVPFSAYDVVNGYTEARLAGIIRDFGEERWARRIAQFIVSERAKRPIATTGQLVEVIKKAIPAGARREGPHPAKRTFQAIRIEVNQELEILRDSFEQAVKRLRSGGRLCIITFHSLEDRIAKQTLQDMAKTCICPPKLPVCVCNHRPLIRLIGKPVIPLEQEVAGNPRARSAKLRVAERL